MKKRKNIFLVVFGLLIGIIITISSQLFAVSKLPASYKKMDNSQRVVVLQGLIKETRREIRKIISQNSNKKKNIKKIVVKKYNKVKSGTNKNKHVRIKKVVKKNKESKIIKKNNKYSKIGLKNKKDFLKKKIVQVESRITKKEAALKKIKKPKSKFLRKKRVKRNGKMIKID